MSRQIILITILLIIVYPASSQESITEEWITFFEKSDYFETPRYDESMEYFRQLSDSSDFATMFPFGVSPQGRNLYCVAVSRDTTFEPIELRNRTRPVILIINGIHSGEIGGKDASMLLLREIVITREQDHLLDNVDILVVPIFSVDGHERFGPYNRINQNGPIEMGWRTTAQNYNLNRDWMKADAPEMQAMLELINTWNPDFIIDTHSTNGADYQYTITYILETHRNIYNEIAAWLNDSFIPHMKDHLENDGYSVFPYVTMRQWFAGVQSGITNNAASPRFSSGYAAVQNRPGLVVETHMSKPYKDRVFSTKSMIESVLEYANTNSTQLLDLNRNADWISIEKYHTNASYLPLDFTISDEYRLKTFKGIKSERMKSDLTGTEIITYTGEPVEKEIRFYDDVVVSDSVTVPQMYVIPKEWSDIVKRMRFHGIKIETITEEVVLPVTRYRFTEVDFASNPFEGRHQVDAEYEIVHDRVSIPEGTYIVATDQRTIRVITHLLEPKSPDSFLRWGFFNSIFERKEYFELYVMEPIAQQMIQDDPGLKDEFEQWLDENPEVKDNPYQRLYFFYERSPYYDDQFNMYPVMRVE